MAKLVGRPHLGMTVTLELDEREARFLDGLLGYGGEALIRAAYDKLGTHYIKPFEEDGLSFCTDAKQQLGFALARIDRARKAFESDASTQALQTTPTEPQ